MKKLELRVHPTEPGPDESRIIDIPPGGRYKRVAVFRGIELRAVTEREMKDYQRDLGPETLALFLPEPDQSFDLYEIDEEVKTSITPEWAETVARAATDPETMPPAGRSVGDAVRLQVQARELELRINDLETRMSATLETVSNVLKITTITPPKELLDALNELGRGAVDTMRRTRASRWANPKQDWRDQMVKDAPALIERLRMMAQGDPGDPQLGAMRELLEDWVVLHRQHEELRSDVDSAVQAVFGVMHADPVKAIRDSGLALRRRLEKAERRLTEAKTFTELDETMTVGELRDRMKDVPDHLPVIVEVMNASDNDDLPMGGLVAPDVETRCDGQECFYITGDASVFPEDEEDDDESDDA